MMFGAFDQFTNRTALISENEVVSYAELFSRGEELGRALTERSLVLTMATNTSEFVAGYTGFMRAGMVQLIVSDTISPEFLANLISIYSPAYAFVPEASSLAGKIVRTARGYKIISLAPSNKCELHPDLALLLSTSGTTGSPKLVRLSRQNIEANTTSILEYLGIGSIDRTITTMPLSYSYGLSILNTHLTAGASIVMTEASIMSREFWDLFKKNEVTSFGGVPYFFEMLKKLRFERMNLPSLRYFTQAGGKLAADLGAEFTQIALERNLRFYIMYGQTEATARISYFCTTDAPEKVGSIGRPVPGGEIWLENDLGQKVVQAGEPGELVYRGPNVSLGFAESPVDLALGDTNHGVLKTGDLAIRDQDGFYSIVGRKNRFLKVFGLRINLVHLEDVLRSKGFECACVGTDQKLVIYLTQIDDLLDLEKMIFELTGVHKNGFQLLKIDAIPRTSSGKIHYSALESLRGSE